MPASAVSLERLLLRVRVLGEQLLSMDMYDRWGQGADPAMNAMLANAGGIGAEHQRATRELDALVAQLRESDPEAVIAWADAHERLLARFLENTTDDTARFVGEEEQRGWRALRDGSGGVVRENVYYVHVDPVLHRSLFGDPAAPT